MRAVLALCLVLAACSNGAGDDPTTTTVPETTTSTVAITTTTTVPPGDCPPAPYELGFLPAGVGQGEPDLGAEPDVWTSVAGSHTTFVPRSDDTVAIAIVRGALPAVDWPNEKGEVSVDGTPAVVGPHPDGTWVAGWFEEPGERCDLYTMVFYPPWAPSDVEQVLAEMDRVGG